MPDALPAVLAATRGLHLIARRLVGGLRAGIHASRQPGLAREFSQYRAYQPGDEPRRIDWKLLARSDRYFVRESEIDNAVTVRLLLDATASMRHASGGIGEDTRKFDCARILAAALAYLAHGQGDPVALHAIADARVIVSLPPGQQRQPLEHIVSALAALEPSGQWPGTESGLRALHTALGPPAPGRELVIVLTDGHQENGEIDAALAVLRARRAEILFLHLLARDELDFTFRGPVRFEDWETGAAFETNADAARDAFLADRDAALLTWRRAWEGERFHYALFATDEPPAQALRAFLLRRSASGMSRR